MSQLRLRWSRDREYGIGVARRLLLVGPFGATEIGRIHRQTLKPNTYAACTAGAQHRSNNLRRLMGWLMNEAAGELAAVARRAA